jgi:hypothetical protein
MMIDIICDGCDEHVEIDIFPSTKSYLDFVWHCGKCGQQYKSIFQTQIFDPSLYGEAKVKDGDK